MPEWFIENWINSLIVIAGAAGAGAAKVFMGRTKKEGVEEIQPPSSVPNELNEQDLKALTAATKQQDAIVIAQETERFISTMLKLVVPLADWGEVSAQFQAMVNQRGKFTKNRARRVIIFCAINGKDHPTKTWSLYQWREDGKEFIAYRAVDLLRPEDNGHYINLLKQTELLGSVRIKVQELGTGLLAGFYHEEDIKDSMTVFMGSVLSNVTKQRAMFYASVATDDPLMLAEEDIRDAPKILDEAKRVMHTGLITRMTLGQENWKVS